MSSRFDVVIAGGSMIGAALALALAQQGKRVAVIEPAEMDAYHSSQAYDLRVSAITPASRNLLDNLGAWEKLEKMRLCPFRKMQVEDQSGQGALEFRAAEIREDYLGYIIENRLVALSLQSVAKDHERISWFFDSVTAYALEQDDAIITLEGGKVLLAQLLVGADGANSWIRQAANIELLEKDYQQRAVVAVIKVRAGSELLAWQRFLKHEVLAFLPLDAEHYSIVWSMQTARAEQLMESTSEDFLTALQGGCNSHFSELQLVGERQSFPLSGRHAESYVKARLALVGDAAHTIHPLAGQGGNLGFLDVAELARVLGESDRDLGSLHVLRKYQRRRAGENKLMQHALEVLQEMYSNDNTLLKTARRAGTKLISRTGPIKSLLMQHASGHSPDTPELLRPRR